MGAERKHETFKTLQSVCGFLRVIAGIAALVGFAYGVIAAIIGDGAGMVGALAAVVAAGAFFVQVEIARVLIAIERNTRRPRSERTSREE